MALPATIFGQTHERMPSFLYARDGSVSVENPGELFIPRVCQIIMINRSGYRLSVHLESAQTYPLPANADLGRCINYRTTLNSSEETSYFIFYTCMVNLTLTFKRILNDAVDHPAHFQLTEDSPLVRDGMATEIQITRDMVLEGEPPHRSCTIS